jgi:hypothetical protein
MKNARTRLSRLELSISRAIPEIDWRTTPAYLAMDEEVRQTFESYVSRFNAEGLKTFTDDELNDFERILMPLVMEEKSINEVNGIA